MVALLVSEVTWWDNNNIMFHNWAGYSETCTIGCIFWKQRCIQRASQVCMVRFLPGSFPSAKEQNTDAHKSTYHDACSKYPSPFHLFFLILLCITRHEGLWFFLAIEAPSINGFSKRVFILVLQRTASHEKGSDLTLSDPCTILWEVQWGNILAMEVATGPSDELPCHVLIHLRYSTKSFAHVIHCYRPDENRYPQASYIYQVVYHQWRALGAGHNLPPSKVQLSPPPMTSAGHWEMFLFWISF